MQKVDPAFANEQIIDGNSSLQEVGYDSFVGIKNHGSPAQVCLRNPELQKRLKEITGIQSKGLCQECLLAEGQND